MLRKFLIISLLMLSLSNILISEDKFPVIPTVICGINQPTSYYATNFAADEPWNLNDKDIANFKAMGVNTIRIPVYPKNLGITTELYLNAGQTFDIEATKKWEIKWDQLDKTLEQFAKNGITPYICPHPNHWMTIYIPEDRAMVEWYTLLIINHITEKFGDNIIYGYYENIWKNSHDPWWTGEYRHTKSPEFKLNFQKELSKKYLDSINNLNASWKSDYKSFDDIEIPSMGSVDAGIPKSALNSIKTYDLRYSIDMLSKAALTELKEKIKIIAPKSIWVGACFHDGFGGLGQVKGGNPPNCNWSLRTHAITSDIISADNYQRKASFLAAYRTVAKISDEEDKAFIGAEINGTRESDISLFKNVGGPNRGALIWSGKDPITEFGIMDMSGNFKQNANAVKDLFTYLTENKTTNSIYKKGKIYVYYPEETYEYMVCWENYLDTYISLFENLNSNDIEPVTTNELLKLPQNTEIYVFEKNLPQIAIDNLNTRDKKVITPHDSFVNEYGKEIKRNYTSKDFYKDLEESRYGAEVKNAFYNLEEKAFNIAKPELGTKITIPSELFSENEADMPQNIPQHIIDGDPVASRIMFADKNQKEEIILELAKAQNIYGAFLITAAEDMGRIPEKIEILISNDKKSWTSIYNYNQKITVDRIQMRFKPIKTKFIKFNLGESTDKTGTRIMEIGILGKN